MTALRVASPLALLLVLGSTGCGGGPGRGGFGREAPLRTPATLEITNRNTRDVRVYLIRDRTRVRLASVESMATVTVELPRDVVGSAGRDLRFQADLIGSPEGYTSDPVFVTPGQRVLLTVESNVRLSHVTVW